jgi:hypothetical protein
MLPRLVEPPYVREGATVASSASSSRKSVVNALN